MVVSNEVKGGAALIREGVSWEEYRAIPKMNPSTIVHGLHSMKRLKRVMEGGYPEETNQMRFGTGLHALLLEPDEFEDRFCVMPDFHLDDANVVQGGAKKGQRTESKNTSYVKERRSQFGRDNAGKSIIGREQYDSILRCIESIRERPKMAALIDRCSKEVTLEGEIGNIPWKGRVDLLCTDKRQAEVCDIKTTGSCDKFAFGRIFVRLHYAEKMACYRELLRQNGIEPKRISFITQEPDGDFDNAYVPIEDIILDNAWPRVEKVMIDYHRCMKSGEWPGVDGGKDQYELAVPNWAMPEDEIEWSEDTADDSEPVEVYW